MEQFIRIHMKDEKLDLLTEKALLRLDGGKDEHIFLLLSTFFGIL